MEKWSLGTDWLIVAEAYPGFCSIKRLGVFLLPLDEMLVHRRSLPHNLLGFPNNSLVPVSTPGWREALWELSVLPKTTTLPPARTRTRTAWSRDERTDHEATAALVSDWKSTSRGKWLGLELVEVNQIHNSKVLHTLLTDVKLILVLYNLTRNVIYICNFSKIVQVYLWSGLM